MCTVSWLFHKAFWRSFWARDAIGPMSMAGPVGPWVLKYDFLWKTSTPGLCTKSSVGKAAFPLKPTIKVLELPVMQPEASQTGFLPGVQLFNSIAWSFWCRMKYKLPCHVGPPGLCFFMCYHTSITVMMAWSWYPYMSTTPEGCKQSWWCGALQQDPQSSVRFTGPLPCPGQSA